MPTVVKSLSIQHSDDDGACCDPLGQKQRKQQQSPEIAYTDVDLAKEMNELSFEQREKILEDVHGVAAVQDETPEFVDTCIREFDEFMAKYPSKDRKAYNKAMFLKPKLQKDRKFKLMFLRAEEFDAEKAVARMVRYFQQKSDLFGPEKLVKRITLDDLTEAEIYQYKIGYQAELPYRDRSGRPIIFGDGTKLDFDKMTIENILRVYWYMMVSCFEDEVAQKKGVCVVLRFSGGRRSISKSTELAKRSAYNNNCFPGRNTSFHFTYDDPRMNFVLNVLRVSTGRGTRVRMRTHFGSELENDYKLLTFGIPSTNLLQNAKRGDLSLARQFLQMCRDRDVKAIEREEQEQAQAPDDLILYPNPKDVLIGRGQPYRELPSNAIWDKAIQALCDQYRVASTFEKTCMSMDVVKTVKDTGARFLERSADGWKVLDDVVARKKTSVAFRNRSRVDTSSSSFSAVAPPAAPISGPMVGSKVPASLRDDHGMMLTSAHAAKRARTINSSGMEGEQQQQQQQRQQPGFFFDW